MENPNLPNELLMEIFSRVPAKSAGKFRSLSKLWKTDLSTPHFTKKHLITRKKTIKQQNVALTTKDNNLCIITSPTKEDEAFKIKEGEDKWFFVLGSCNGLVLLVNGSDLVVLNPITFQQVTVPSILAPERKKFDSFDGFDLARGFGYDASSDDYKVVNITGYDVDNKTFVDVYSLNNGVWETLPDGSFPYDNYFPKADGSEGGAFLNGAVHWLVYGDGTENVANGAHLRCIAAFDLATEVFSEIALPEELATVNVGRFNEVSAVGGFLVIVNKYGDGSDVWVMKEYGSVESWVKFRIEDYKWAGIVATLCYVDDVELLCLITENCLVGFDLLGETARKLNPGECDYMFANGMAFVDTLVSP